VLPSAQNTTVGKLVKAGFARQAKGEEADAALSEPGKLLWLDNSVEPPVWREA